MSNQRFAFCLLSKRKLQSGLNEAWGSSLHNRSEQRAVDIALNRRRAEELRVVEDVESLQPELRALLFCDPEILQQREIRIELSRAIERSPRRVARRAERALRECLGIEVGQRITGISVETERQAV